MAFDYLCVSAIAFTVHNADATRNSVRTGTIGLRYFLATTLAPPAKWLPPLGRCTASSSTKPGESRVTPVEPYQLATPTPDSTATPATSGWCFTAHDSTTRCSHAGRSRIPSSSRTRARRPGTAILMSTIRRSITPIRRGIGSMMGVIRRDALYLPKIKQMKIIIE